MPASRRPFDFFQSELTDMYINPYLFILPRSPGQIVWNYKNHTQHELDLNYATRLAQLINNPDLYETAKYLETGDFNQHDFTVRYDVRDDLTLRFGVVNAFDAEQAPYLGTTLYSNFDPYGRRFFIGLNYRPF